MTNHGRWKLRGLATTALVAAALTATEPAAAIDAEAKGPLSGLVLVQGASLTPVDASEPKGEQRRRYRIVAVIAQPPGAQPITTNDTISETLAATTTIGTDEASDIIPGYVFLRLVRRRNGSLEFFGETVAIPVKDATNDPVRVAAFEAKAFRRDVLKLRSAKTISDVAAQFASLTASTPTPSGSLILEGERLYSREGLDDCSDPGLSAKDYSNLSDGFLNLAFRADSPQYAWTPAIHNVKKILGRILCSQRGQEHEIALAARLLDTFHDGVFDSRRGDAYPEQVFGFVEALFGRSEVCSSSVLKERLERLPKDLAAYVERLERAGSKADAKRIMERRTRVLETLSRPKEDAEAKGSASGRPLSGLVLFQIDSIVPLDAKRPSGERVRTHRIVSVIEQPLRGKAIDAGAMIREKTWPNRFESGVRDIIPDDVFLQAVRWEGESLVPIGERIAIPVEDRVKDPLRVAELELKGFRRDVLKLRTAKTKSEAAAEFKLLTASTPSPSGSLVLESERFYMSEDGSNRYETGLSTRDFANLSEGALNLMIRVDAPEYVRSCVRNLDVHSIVIAITPEADDYYLHVAARLLDAFHDGVSNPKCADGYPEDIYRFLDFYLDNANVRSAPSFKVHFVRLADDLTDYAKRLEQAGKHAEAERQLKNRERMLERFSQAKEAK